MAYEITISEDYHGVKPKNFLKKNLDLPYYQLFKFIKEKRITLNGKKIKDESILNKGDIIKIWLDTIKLKQDSKEKILQKEDFKLDILFENKSFLILNKLPGIIVQGAFDNTFSLSKHLAYLKEKNNDFSDFNYFHVHRIDKDTSGCLVIAKTRIALRELNSLFESKQVKKKYICLCAGSFEEKSGLIELYLLRNEQNSLQKVRAVQKKIDGSKKTISRYKVIEEILFEKESFSLVEVEIETGFMHQIRVHMKFLGHPILGDKMYGNSYLNSLFESKLSRQFLHAQNLEFEYKGEKFNIIAPLTKDLENFLKYIKKN